MAEHVSRKCRRHQVIQAKRMRASKPARRQMSDYSDEPAPDEASASSVRTEQSQEEVPSLDSLFLLPLSTNEAGYPDSSD